jgi:hypothetical protein
MVGLQLCAQVLQRPEQMRFHAAFADLHCFRRLGDIKSVPNAKQERLPLSGGESSQRALNGKHSVGIPEARSLPIYVALPCPHFPKEER